MYARSVVTADRHGASPGVAASTVSVSVPTKADRNPPLERVATNLRGDNKMFT